MTWQPIETAPKDGTHLLVSCGEYGIKVAWYDLYPRYGSSLWVPLGGDGSEQCYPLHWMPLPDAPAVAA